MIIYCCGAMRSGSTLLYSLIYALVKAEKKYDVINARVDSTDQLQELLDNYKKMKVQGGHTTLVINGTFSKEIYEMLPLNNVFYISCLRLIEDCLGSAKQRWGYRWKNSKAELEKVLVSLRKTMEGIQEVPKSKIVVFDYPQLYEETDKCLRTLAKCLGYNNLPLEFYTSLCNMVKEENKNTSTSLVLKVSRSIRESLIYYFVVKVSRKLLSNTLHKKIGLYVKNKILKKYSTQSYIGPGHISQNNGVPGSSSEALNQYEKTIFSQDMKKLNQLKTILVLNLGAEVE